MTEGCVADVLRWDPMRWRLLGVARDRGPPDGWVAAGFVRDAVWDRLHGWAPRSPGGDVDVIWFDPRKAKDEDGRFEMLLRAAEPGADWSVRNQARMHRRNGDPPYGSVSDAMRHWPDTATAVAVRRSGAEGIEVLAPLGLADLFGLLLRPGPAFTGARRGVFEARLRDKRWLGRWPGLTVVDG